MGHWLRTIEAAAALTMSKALIATLPFSWVVAILGRVEHPCAEDGRTADPTEVEARAVGRALRSAALRIPWPCTCLVMALGGHLMCVRRGMRSRVVLGVLPSEARFEAHAWLVAGGGVVSGREQATAFRPIAAIGRG